jgi:hypothetical protein
MAGSAAPWLIIDSDDSSLTAEFSHMVCYGRTSVLGSAVVRSLAGHGQARPSRPMGPPLSPGHALVWLPFSGTTVMAWGLLADGPDADRQLQTGND